jgi:CDGSH-type Zn-finger protein/uncharacterized Fe-S cluster protein YjdI
MMSKKIQKYEGKNITIFFEGSRCIHAARCVSGLPNVFKANVPGPWIDPDAADVEELTALIKTCPSGALTYERSDKIANENPPDINSISVIADGPLAVHGSVTINNEPGASPRATLCRCGASKNKPFCDNSHKSISFHDNGTPEVGNLSLELTSGAISVSTVDNGPLMIVGPVEVRSTDGSAVNRTENVALCRCGASKNKPYCDGSHTRIEFNSK